MVEYTRKMFIEYVRSAMDSHSTGNFSGRGVGDNIGWTDGMEEAWRTIAMSRFASVNDDDESILPSPYKSSMPADPHTGMYRPANVGLKKTRNPVTGKGLTARVAPRNEIQRSNREMNKLKEFSDPVFGDVHDMFRYDRITGRIWRCVKWYRWFDKVEGDPRYGFHPDPYRPSEMERRPIDPNKDRSVIPLPTEVWSVHTQSGRLYMTVRGVKYWAHHIAWELSHFTKPRMVTFRDGDPTNLKYENIAMTNGQSTHVVGDRVVVIPKPYQARVRHLGKIKCLGSFHTKEARDEAVIGFKFKRSLGMV